MTETAKVLDAKDAFSANVETAWITAAKGGDRHAYHQLYRQHVGPVYGLCLRMLADKDAAEDVCQEVFVQVWLKLDNFRGESKFSTWLHRIATNQVFTHMRKQKSWWQRIVSKEDVANDDACAVNHIVEDHGELGDLDKHILKLPTRARQVFILFAIEGYRHEEIAQLMGMATGSSKAQYHRARQLLQEWLGQ